MPKVELVTHTACWRVSEFSKSYECMAYAYHARQELRAIQRALDNGKEGGEMKIKTFSTFDSVKGTKVHWHIEKFLCKIIGRDPPPLVWRPEDEVVLKDIKRHPELKAKFDKLVKHSFKNFMEFWETFQPEVIAIEEEMSGVVDGKPVSGRLDAVLGIQEDRLDRQLVFASPRGRSKRVIIADWKSGSYHSSVHVAQISGYYYLAQKRLLPRVLKKKRKYYKVDEEPQVMIVYLGGKSWDARIFSADTGRLFRISKIIDKAEPLPINPQFKKLETSSRKCLFCRFLRLVCKVAAEGEVSIWDLPQFSNASLMYS